MLNAEFFGPGIFGKDSVNTESQGNVVHCGISLSGMFVYTIDTVDIASGRTEQRAICGKGEPDVLEQLQPDEPYYL
jgi:hypothetical protein